MNIEQTPVSTIIFLATITLSLLSFSNKNRLMEKMISHPFSVIHKNKWYRILSSAFVHADIAHLLFNMLTFYFFAFRLEQTIGSLAFLIVYIGSQIVSSIPELIKHRNNENYHSLGASGAISGILFSYILFYPSDKIGVFLIPFGIPAWIFAGLYLVYCWFAARKAQDMINHDAHFYGALTGLLLTVLLQPESLKIFIKAVF